MHNTRTMYEIYSGDQPLGTWAVIMSHWYSFWYDYGEHSVANQQEPRNSNMTFNADVSRQGCRPGRFTSVLLGSHRDQKLDLVPTPTTQITQWMLDTRPLWPVTATATPKEQMGEFKTSVCVGLFVLLSTDRAQPETSNRRQEPCHSSRRRSSKPS